VGRSAKGASLHYARPPVPRESWTVLGDMGVDPADGVAASPATPPPPGIEGSRETDSARLDTELTVVKESWTTTTTTTTTTVTKEVTMAPAVVGSASPPSSVRHGDDGNTFRRTVVQHPLFLLLCFNVFLYGLANQISRTLIPQLIIEQVCKDYWGVRCHSMLFHDGNQFQTS